MSVRAFTLPAVLGAILVLAAATGAQEEQWLQYRRAREAAHIAGGLNRIPVELTDDEPAGVELPKFTGKTVFFAKWATPMVESGYLWIALDRAPSGLQNSLYIDSDGDGRLDDETAVAAYRTGQYNAYFGPVKVIFQVEDGPVTYHLNLRFYMRGSDDRRLYASAGGWYEGDITIGERKRHCVLLDYNANGAFDDRALDSDQCDRIQISENNKPMPLFVGKYLESDGALYLLDIARDGAFVKLARAEDVKYGSVRLSKTVSEFSAGGENGLFSRRPGGGTGRLPVGTYRITNWTLERKDDSGAQWRLQGIPASGDISFEVHEGRETALEIGEPINAVVQAAAREGTYGFNQSLRGRHGERIELTRNGARPQAPRLNIRNEDGTYDRTYSFAYG